MPSVAVKVVLDPTEEPVVITTLYFIFGKDVSLSIAPTCTFTDVSPMLSSSTTAETITGLLLILSHVPKALNSQKLIKVPPIGSTRR